MTTTSERLLSLPSDGTKPRTVHTGGLGAEEPGFDDHQFDVFAADAEVFDLLAGALMHPSRDHPAVRAGRLDAVGNGADPPAAQRQITGCEHLVTVQVEHHRGRIPNCVNDAAGSGQGQVWARRLEHGSRPSVDDVILRRTHHPARARAP